LFKSENSWFSNYLDTLEVFQLISNRNIVNSQKHVHFDCQKITKIFTINNNYVHNSGAPYRMNISIIFLSSLLRNISQL